MGIRGIRFDDYVGFYSDWLSGNTHGIAMRVGTERMRRKGFKVA